MPEDYACPRMCARIERLYRNDGRPAFPPPAAIMLSFGEIGSADLPKEILP
jgi:hypothetical protein